MTDLLILGAGPAGAAAAIEARALGLSVTLIDENPAAGGQVARAPASGPGPGDDLRASLARSGAAHRAGWRAWDVAPDTAGWRVEVTEGTAAETLCAPCLLIAAGARELPRPRPGWTLPGVLSLAGLTTFLKVARVPPPGPIALSGAGPLAVLAASEVVRLGGTVSVLALSETRGDWARALSAMAGRPDLLAKGAAWLARLARVPVLWGATAEAVEGAARAEALIVGGRRYAAGTIALGGPLAPEVAPAALAGLALRHDVGLGGWVPEAGPDGTTARGGLYVAGDG
ncbi:MAG: FAD-dependent oxidoreductase, partial [Pseudomonadota bacterium]